jgi:chemotaxis protein methyltransferase CheR
MNDLDFKFYEELLKKESGLIVTPEKTYLLESRLLPIAHKIGVQGLEGLANKMRTARDTELLRMVVEAMTTNETSFFRDNTPFQRLKEDILPYLIKTRGTQKSLRIWSAACSSGQEAYSTLMLLKEYGAALAGWKFEVVATDLSMEILAQAKAGAYTQFEVQRGLPIQMLVKYFTQQGDKWLIKPELKDMVTFKTANLLGDIGTLGQFDIVFCRNVLIYFDLATKGKVLSSIKNVTKKDGVLFLGGSETVIGVSDSFKAYPDIKGVYVREDSTFAPDKKPAAAVIAPVTATAATSAASTTPTPPTTTAVVR